MGPEAEAAEEWVGEAALLPQAWVEAALEVRGSGYWVLVAQPSPWLLRLSKIPCV